MFENYKQLSDAEKASVKEIHRAIRAQAGNRYGNRYGNLAWAYVRGFPYKRVERTVHENNEPSAVLVTSVLAQHIPGFAEYNPKRPWDTKASPEIEAWLANEEGAIPAPVREKRPYVRHELKAEVA